MAGPGPCRAPASLTAGPSQVAAGEGSPAWPEGRASASYEAARSVDRYLRVRAKHALAARPELWLGISGRGPVTPDGIYQIVANAGRRAGVAVYPHRFRHHFSHTYSRMRRLYWAARDRAAGMASEEEFSAALSAYREVITDWNDNLNRILALAGTYFGGGVRAMLETQVYERFASLGRGLDVMVRIVSAAGGKQIDVPRFGHRLNALSHRVYELDAHMLDLLSDQRAGRTARPVPTPDGMAGSRVLAIGDLGGAVRRLQRALRRDGQQVAVDGQFGRQTWLAVRSAQRAHGLNVDGIAGPQTWAALPAGGPMPVLRVGSSGPVVTALQEILTRNAPGRWETAPEAVTGEFDQSTSAAVLAFQRWNAISIDGQVGDQTWTATVGDARVSLEDTVGLQHAADA